MKSLLAATSALAFLVMGAVPSNANLQLFQFVNSAATPGAGSAPVSLEAPKVGGLDFPNNGVTPVASGTTLSLAVQPGIYSGNVITRSYRWHTVDAPATTLGTGATIALDLSANPGLVNQAIEVDETATGLAGPITVMSHWFGPLSMTAPVAPPQPELTSATTGPTQLPQEPANFLECFGPGTIQHAVFPGGAIPPCAPNTNTAHVWIVDPINGTTQAAQTSAGVPTASQGRVGHPFKDIAALFNTFTGYPSGGLFGFGKTIPPGDTIYLEPGNAANPLGALTGGPFNVGSYSTTDGTPNGPIAYTWIMKDPANALRPIVSQISFTNGAAGFVIRDIGVERYRSGNSINLTFNNAAPTLTLHDMHFEHLCVSSWLNHCNDQFPVHYPSDGGTSEGSILSASPMLSNVFGSVGQDPPTFVATSTNFPADPTKIGVSAIPNFGAYIWSPGYFRSQAKVATPSTGIPNGSKVSALNGITNYTNGATVNSISDSELLTATGNSSLIGHLLTGSPFATTTALNANPGDGTTYAIVAGSTTSTQTLFTWNGAAWVSIGTEVPSTATGNPVDLLSGVVSANPRIAHWNGTAWVNLGAPVATIAPCDPSADAATGCPSTPIPGCDPIISFSTGGTGKTTQGGCPGGVPQTWVGTTRALTGETVSTTNFLIVTPAGFWNATDWDGDNVATIQTSGVVSGASLDPANPNAFAGVSNVSIQDSTIRAGFVGLSNSHTNNIIYYNNMVEWLSADGVDNFSSNRSWVIHNQFQNWSSIWAHQDCIQGGVSSGGEGAVLFGAAYIENECYAATDATNYIPSVPQGIGAHDLTWWNTYNCCNIINISGPNALLENGSYSVMAHNTVIGGSAVINSGANGTAPISLNHSLMANNISMGNSRSLITNTCDPTTGDLITVEGNLSISSVGPGVTPSTPSLRACLLGSTTGIQNGASEGPFVGVNSWTGQDWQTDVGVSPLFTAYHPLPAPVPPAPGANAIVMQTLNSCTANSFPPFGNCAGPDGIANFRPNPSFSGVGTGAVFAGAVNITWLPCGSGTALPTSAAEGSFWFVFTATSGTGCGAARPSGIWQFCTAITITCPSDTPFDSGHPGWVAITGSSTNLNPTFSPGIISQGTALTPWASGGPRPISDIGGGPWSATPSIGAFESH